MAPVCIFLNIFWVGFEVKEEKDRQLHQCRHITRYGIHRVYNANSKSWSDSFFHAKWFLGNQHKIRGLKKNLLKENNIILGTGVVGSLICKRQTFRLKTFNWPTIAADSSNGKRNEKGDRREIPSDVESHQVLAYFSFFSFLIGRCFNALVLFLFLIDFCKRLAAVRQSITAYRQNQFSATKNKKESRPTTRKKKQKKGCSITIVVVLPPKGHVDRESVNVV